jgi:hypothetical protein
MHHSKFGAWNMSGGWRLLSFALTVWETNIDEPLDFAFGVIEKLGSTLTVKETLYWEVDDNRFLKNSAAKMVR